MENIIKVTENGSDRKLSMPRESIAYYEALVYNDGIRVTVITLLNNSTFHVKETVAEIDRQFL